MLTKSQCDFEKKGKKNLVIKILLVSLPSASKKAVVLQKSLVTKRRKNLQKNAEKFG